MHAMRWTRDKTKTSRHVAAYCIQITMPPAAARLMNQGLYQVQIQLTSRSDVTVYQTCSNPGLSSDSHFIQLLDDPFIRIIIVRFCFCVTVLHMHSAFKVNTLSDRINLQTSLPLCSHYLCESSIVSHLFQDRWLLPCSIVEYSHYFNYFRRMITTLHQCRLCLQEKLQTGRL